MDQDPSLIWNDFLRLHFCGRWNRGWKDVGQSITMSPQYKNLNSSCLLPPFNPHLPLVLSLSANGPTIISTTLTRNQRHPQLSLCCPHSMIYSITKTQSPFLICGPLSYLLSLLQQFSNWYPFSSPQNPPIYPHCSYQNDLSKMQIWSFLSPPLLKPFTGSIWFTG